MSEVKRASWRHHLAAGLPNGRLGDALYHRGQFQTAHRRSPRPRRGPFNDALYFIKRSGLLDTDLRRFISDKEHVKLFVRATVGEDYNVPTLGIARSVPELTSLQVPRNSIVKPTHASGFALLGRNNPSLDVLRQWLSLDYYRLTRERNYIGLQKKIIVEPLVFDDESPLDFKFHCVGGKIRFVHVDFDRKTFHTRAFFDREFRRLPFSVGYPVSARALERPRNFDTMVAVAEALAQRFSLIRIDMYTDGHKAFVGEITNVHGNAHERFFPESAEEEFGYEFVPSGDFADTLLT